MRGQRTDGKVTVTLAAQEPSAIIRYTTDGTLPVASSPIYGKPVEAALPVTISATSFASDGSPLARVRTQRFDAQTLASYDGNALQACPKGDLGLRVPLLPDATSPAPVYNVDLMNSCWRVTNVPLDGAVTMVIDGAWLARNYGLAHDASKVKVRASRTPAGEFEVHLDTCSGPLAASMPLPTDALPGRTYRVTAPLAAHGGTHDLCILSTAPVRGSLSGVSRVSFHSSASRRATP